MEDVPDIDPDKQLLTVDQAYLAAYEFIRQFYERDGRKPESMFLLLSDMELEAPRMTSGPAQWHDWVSSVAKAVEPGEHSPFSEPVSQPLTK
jgi:hypothetical protein